MKFQLGMAAAFCAVAGVGLALTFQHPPVDVIQRGYRGTAMYQVVTRNDQELKAYANTLPPPEPPADLTGVPASQVYQNVQVLGDIDAAELTRLMTAMTNWVSPKQGCNYCHEAENLASDKLYTKVVARRMIQMTRHINADWKTHVATTGVTCYTCHRGNPVPLNIWFDNPGPKQALGMLGNRAGQNDPTMAPGMASLPYDPFSPFLHDDKEIRVISTTALPAVDHQSIKQTEWTYSLMMHFSEALGVNCTFCHNTRSFAEWDTSTPQRATAWYGIRLVRDLNQNVLDPLKALLPPQRWGALGDGPKVNCTTCHQNAYKPLLGQSMLKDYEELASATAASVPAEMPADAPAAPAPAPAAPAPAAPAPMAPEPAAPAAPPAAP